MTPSSEKPPLPLIDGQEVRLELDRVLTSSVFRGSRRCHDFLRYVVFQSLDGEAENLKERALAVEVFGRAANADLTEDSIVRVGAREVRKRLAQYYVGEGAQDPVRIELPPGSYVPAFHAVTSEQAVPVKHDGPAVEVAPPRNEPGPGSNKRGRISLKAVAAGVVLLAAAGTLMWQKLRPVNPEFESFWRPAFEQSGPILVVLPHPIIYHPSSNANRLNEKLHGTPALPHQAALDVPAQMLDGGDFVPVTDQYVGLGDTLAAFQLGQLFTERRQLVRVRLASKVEFADLRDSVTVLIGAFTNRWTVELTSKFRYRFSLEDGHKPSIIDSTTGERRWSLVKSDSGQSTEDYILVCRLPHSESGGFAILGAGLTQYGTQEAGRILSDPNALAPLLRRIPQDWQSKNVELVLHSQIVGDATTPPSLVGWHIW